MSLPILKVTSAPTTETLIRYFHQTQSNWSSHVAENTVLDIGTAWVNPELNRVHVANRMLDVALPADITPAQAVQLADEHFASHGTTCWQWVMNPSAPAAQTAPMIEHLRSLGFGQLITQIMYLDRMPSSLPASSDASLQIIPARASFRHARALNEEAVSGPDQVQRIEATMLHLDDPHYDALLALRDGVAVAMVGVLAVGEIGMIAQVYVAEAHRRRAIGTTMMGRALEICARSLFKHVLLDVWSEALPAIRLYERFGFKTIGQYVAHQRPPIP